AEMLGLLCSLSGCFFGSYDEDYGYVTLEAMLAAKPVITCNDSGEAVEFVIDQETGFVVNPEPEAIAQAIDDLYFHQQRAFAMGIAGLERYKSLNISWNNVIQQILW
ncbi:glycosyltransferase family 4 protein, partial [Nostoc sp. HG1]|nr:glycosyltransferase family 4 protein [Nostoc sp. HG1]